ncbi:hypothetical protein Tco_1382837 [Tanacetum coccineum]
MEKTGINGYVYFTLIIEAINRDETESGVRGPVEVRVKRVTHPVMPEDIPEPAQEGAIEAIYETLGDLREQGHRMVGVELAVIALTKKIAELERDNMRLRGTKVKMEEMEMEVMEEMEIEVKEEMEMEGTGEMEMEGMEKMEI